MNNAYFLRTAYNALQKYRGEKEVDAIDFMKLLKQEMRNIGMKEEFLNRSLNEAFQEGRRKETKSSSFPYFSPSSPSWMRRIQAWT